MKKITFVTSKQTQIYAINPFVCDVNTLINKEKKICKHQYIFRQAENIYVESERERERERERFFLSHTHTTRIHAQAYKYIHTFTANTTDKS